MYKCRIMIITYSEEPEYVNNEHDVLEHRHSPSTVDVAKVDDERDRPDLVLLVIDKRLPETQVRPTIIVPCQFVAS
jgi:hypothetical protein